MYGGVPNAERSEGIVTRGTWVAFRQQAIRFPQFQQERVFLQHRPGATMQLGDQRASGNVEDRRGMGIGGGLGVGGIVIALVAYFLGFDPSTVINVAEQVGTQRDTREAPKGAPADEAGQFVSKVLGSTEDVWTRVFQQSGGKYRAPTLVLYDGAVRSACGTGQSAMGPFYCPNDEKLYLALSFFPDFPPP